MSNTGSALKSAPGLLALMSLPGVGPAKALAYARDERGLAELDAESLQRALESAQRDIGLYEGAGVTTVGHFDDRFPSELRGIPNAPAVVYFRGQPDAWRTPALAVVGTRGPTSFGETATTRLTTIAVKAGFAIVSGLALGIDAIAHDAALASDGRTTAVLGSGLDSISPRQHRGLATRILANGGALLSEQPFETDPSPRTLVARNRLQAGLAQALLVGETGIKGGTMHTVRFAAQQGKTIYCPVPHQPSAENAGLTALLETPAEQLPDVLPAWAHAGPLAKRLGRDPLARPVREETASEWIADLIAARSATPADRFPNPEETEQLPLDGM